MATAEKTGPAETGPRVDVGALSAAIAIEARERIAAAVVTTTDRLREKDNELRQTQEIEFHVSALEQSDGLETWIGDVLERQLRADGIETWGRPTR